MLFFRFPVRTEHQDAFRLILGKQSGTEIPQEVGQGTFWTHMLYHGLPFSISSNNIAGEYEERRAVAEKEGWYIFRRARKRGETIFPSRAREREI